MTLNEPMFSFYLYAVQVCSGWIKHINKYHSILGKDPQLLPKLLVPTASLISWDLPIFLRFCLSHLTLLKPNKTTLVILLFIWLQFNRIYIIFSLVTLLLQLGILGFWTSGFTGGSDATLTEEHLSSCNVVVAIFLYPGLLKTSYGMQ